MYTTSLFEGISHTFLSPIELPKMLSSDPIGFDSCGVSDFYVSTISWAFELRVNRNKIVSRGRDKYLPLALKDFAAVDIRINDNGKPTNNKVRYPELITIFLKNGDFSCAHIVFGESHELNVKPAL